MPRLEGKYNIHILKEVSVAERQVRWSTERGNYRNYRGDKRIQLGDTALGRRFRFCYYVRTPSGRKIFGQFAPEYREGDLVTLLEKAVDEKMFTNESLRRLLKAFSRSLKAKK